MPQIIIYISGMQRLLDESKANVTPVQNYGFAHFLILANGNIVYRLI